MSRAIVDKKETLPLLFYCVNKIVCLLSKLVQYNVILAN